MWLAKFVVYGLAGLCLEVVFTGLAAALFGRDRAATGKTYLWMHPIYGATALLLEQVHVEVADLPLFVRGLCYLGVIYAAEFVSGWLLRHLLGQCPWDYGERGLSVRGLVRLDYAPAWFVAGLGAEAAQPVVIAAAQALTGEGWRGLWAMLGGG